jgi:hypothetical protein
MSTKYQVLLIEKSLIKTPKESWHSIFENLNSETKNDCMWIDYIGKGNKVNTNYSPLCV